MITKKDIDNNVPGSVLIELKQRFSGKISPRRLARVTYLSELIAILIKQDLQIEPNFWEGKWERLVIDLIQRYILQMNNGLSNTNCTNLYADERLRTEAQQQYSVNRNGSIEAIFISKKHQIYKHVAKEIGSKWRSFGRELMIGEGELDSLENHERDFATRFHKMMVIAEDYCHPHYKKFVNTFFEALKEVRRKDLIKEIHRMLV